VRDKTSYADVEYLLYDKDGVLRTVKGGTWYIWYGGYHKWTNMIVNPTKHTSIRPDRLWSEWMESIRKDVECCFGILKRRFRILRNGIVLQSQEQINSVFLLTCRKKSGSNYKSPDYT